MYTQPLGTHQSFLVTKSRRPISLLFVVPFSPVFVTIEYFVHCESLFLGLHDTSYFWFSSCLFRHTLSMCLCRLNHFCLLLDVPHIWTYLPPLFLYILSLGNNINSYSGFGCHPYAKISISTPNHSPLLHTYISNFLLNITTECPTGISKSDVQDWIYHLSQQSPSDHLHGYYFGEWMTSSDIWFLKSGKHNAVYIFVIIKNLNYKGIYACYRN